MEKKDNIELRSEKMRNVIGDIPPRLTRAGTIVILVVTVVMLAAAWLVKIDGSPLACRVFGFFMT